MCYSRLVFTDGKTSVMAMAATSSSADITDMDCSPGDIEELIKEVNMILSSYYFKSTLPLLADRLFTMLPLPTLVELSLLDPPVCEDHSTIQYSGVASLTPYCCLFAGGRL